MCGRLNYQLILPRVGQTSHVLGIIFLLAAVSRDDGIYTGSRMWQLTCTRKVVHNILCQIKEGIMVFVNFERRWDTCSQAHYINFHDIIKLHKL